MPKRTTWPVLGVAVGLALSGCAALGGGLGASSQAPPTTASTGDDAASSSPTGQGGEETGWGPTTAELAAARAQVATWTAGQLAGQVMVGRYHGTDPNVAATMVATLHLAGVFITKDNVVDAAQVRRTTTAVHAAVAADGRDIPAVIGVDQEGGTVAHLAGVATDFPPFLAAGAAATHHPQAVQTAAYATGLQLRSLGFTWIMAPIADVTIGRDDPTIGTRSPAADPHLAALAVAAAVAGYDQAGVVSTPKHFPGHGSVTTDSHRAIPTLSASTSQLESRDLQPFRSAVDAHAPTIMMSHIAATAFSATTPSSFAPVAYQYLRTELGFDGVAVTDSLGMGAAMKGGDHSVAALKAGADLLLMPKDTATSHRAVTRAIESGSIPRQRILDAAAKVVALQRWQARIAASVAVPADVTTQAEAASESLSAAAITQVSGRCTGPGGRSYQVTGGDAQDRQRLRAALRAAGLGTGSGPVVQLVLNGGGNADVVVALDWPTALGTSTGRLASYALIGRTEGAYAALAQVLAGKATATGVLPIVVPGRSTSCDQG